MKDFTERRKFWLGSISLHKIVGGLVLSWKLVTVGYTSELKEE